MNQDINIELLEKIESYLNGTLQGSERAGFEQQMKQDSNLAEEVRAYRAINFAIANQDKTTLKNDLVKAKRLIEDVRGSVQVNYEVEAEASPVRDSRRATSQSESSIDSILEKVKQFLFPPQPAFRLAYAMAVVAVLLVSSYLIFFAGGPDTGQLFADNFAPYPDMISSTRSDSDPASSDLKQVMLLYENKEYSGALKGFDKYLSDFPASYDVLFYRGITNIQLGNIDQAVKDLEAVMDNNRTLEHQAKWYLALVHLKKRELKEATEILKDIQGSDNQYSEKANAILEKLNKQ